MDIPTRYAIVFIILALFQLLCVIISRKSERVIKRKVQLVNLIVIIPIISNLLIVIAHNKMIAYIGYCGYYFGMTLLMISLVRFTNEYCQGIVDNNMTHKPTIMYILGILDIIQMIINMCTGTLITLNKTTLNGKVNFKAIPKVGLIVHSIINYVIFLCIILILVICTIRASKFYRNKFTVILVTLIVSGVAQLHYIMSTTDIDRSIILHALLCIIIFYFSIIYKPLRLLDVMLSNVASGMNDAVYMFDVAGKCIWANENGYELLDISKGKINQVKQKLIDKFGNITNQGESWTKDIFLNETDEYFIIEKKSVKTVDTKLDGSFVIVKNSTDKRRQIEQDIYNTMHDNLTGLFNKQYLYNNIRKFLVNSTMKNDFYIIYINVKNFKIINDIFGIDYGDQVLIEIANWLRLNINGTNCVVGRLIGDTFGIFMPEDEFTDELFSNAFSKFIVKYKNIEHQLFIHVGVYKIIDKSLDISVMFDRAHLAVSSITDNYKTCIKYYDETLRNSILEEQRLTADLINALNTNQILPYLQPIVNADGKIIGAEALARWIHPENGFMPPAKFIPIFEKNGMIVEVDKHIWDSACQILNSWKYKYPDLFVSINISPKDFYFIDVSNEIESLVQKYNIDPIKLRIEITETAMMSDPEERLRIFDELRSKGFIVEMDDFGSGYSSLNMLKDMPVDVLKIDMKFLDSSKKVGRSQTIIKNVINMSNELEMTTLTEGVETQQQYNQLVNMGCKLFQGYYFAKPMPLNEFEKFVTTKKEEGKL